MKFSVLLASLLLTAFVAVAQSKTPCRPNVVRTEFGTASKMTSYRMLIYDAKNRVVLEKSEDGEIKTVYTDSTVTRVSPDGTSYQFYGKIGKNGFLSFSIERHTYPQSIEDTTEYYYNAAGYLVKEVSRTKNPDIVVSPTGGNIEYGHAPMISVRKYTIVQGNYTACTTTETTLGKAKKSRTVYEYHMDKPGLSFDPLDPLKKLKGKAGQNLLKKKSLIPASKYDIQEVTVFTYQFDSKGNVIRQERKNKSFYQGREVMEGMGDLLNMAYEFDYDCQ